MKTKVLMACLFMSVSGQVAAQEDLQATLDKTCRSLGDLAEAIMQKRQDGVAMSAMMARVAQLDAGGADLARAYVMAAYEKPVMSVEENKRRYVEEFRSDAEFACYRDFQPAADAAKEAQKTE